MSAKQCAQAVTSRNTERPYVIGSGYQYLTSKLFKHTAEYKGSILYKNSELMLVVFRNGEEEFLETFKITKYMPTADKFAVTLKYSRDVGDFDIGDLLFEYDSYREGIYAGGYNITSAYMNFFGMTFEDSIVISESAAKKMISQKIEKLVIPVYSYSLLKSNDYPNSRYGFIPEIGQSINGRTVYSYYAAKDNANKENLLSLLSLEELIETLNDDYQFNINRKYCRLDNAKVFDIRIHKFKTTKTVLDPNLKAGIETLYKDYAARCRETYASLNKILGQENALHIMSSEYIMNSHKQNLNIVIDNLLYFIEIDLVKEYDVQVGDKLANSFANKGVVSAIIPDHLMPVIESTGDRIDAVVGSLSVYSRMVFAQIIVIAVSKVIKYIEREILQDPSLITFFIEKLIRMNSIIGNSEYSEKLQILMQSIDNNPDMIFEFIKSVENGGLFFEMPNFADFDFESLLDFIEKEFNIKSNETLIYPKDLYPYMAKLTGNEEALLPNKDVYLENIFCGPNYMLRLKQIASNKNTSRDIGCYSASTKQPIKDLNREGNMSSKLGNMEMDALIAHGLVDYVIPELRTVKSDCIDMKPDLISQIIKSGEYIMEKNINGSSYTKSVIDSLMNFLQKDYD